MTDRDSLPLPAVKDEHAEYPIAGAWRAPLREVVRAFVRGDYGLSQGVPDVEAVPPPTAEQIRAYIADYGATLIELPEDTWETSVSRWMGTHWEVLVDLWTAQEGRSDLVLSCAVREVDGGYRLTLDLVYVP
jgi:hypothetical protein